MSDEILPVLAPKGLIRLIRDSVGHRGKSTKVVFYNDDRIPRVLGRKGWTHYGPKTRNQYGEYVHSTLRIEIGVLNPLVKYYRGDIHLEQTTEKFKITLITQTFKRAVKI